MRSTVIYPDTGDCYKRLIPKSPQHSFLRHRPYVWSAYHPHRSCHRKKTSPSYPIRLRKKNTDYISCECTIGCLFEESQKYASKMVLGCVIFPINAIFVGKTGLKHISVTHCKIKIINNILNLLCDFTSKYVYNVITDRVLLQIFYLK